MKYIISIILGLIGSVALFASESDVVINNILNSYLKAGSLTASVSSVTGDQTLSGSVVMQSEKFFLNMKDMKVWYDGKSLWTYTTDAGELMLTEPSEEDLYSISPYAALANYKELFTIKVLSKNVNGITSVRLIPKSSDTVFKQIVLSSNSKTNYIIKVEFYFSNGFTNIIYLNYNKFGYKYPDPYFKYDMNILPEGTPLIDLR